MATAGRTGTTAAGVLPAALAGALLVSAPFAGTTTAPLATSQPQAAVQTQQQPHPRTGLGTADLVTLGGAEALLVGVGAGVIVYARRRRHAEA